MTGSRKRNSDHLVAGQEATPGQPESPEEVTPGSPSADASPDDPVPAEAHGAALVEPADQAVARLSTELDEARDRHLRLAADFDNFRKRTARERLETWTRAQADVVAKLLDAIDDLARVTSLEVTKEAADILAGVALVERKLLKELESAGLERVGEPGEPFDPNKHEAIGTVAAKGESDDGTVADVIQPGYRFGGALLRPARVRVLAWAEGD